MKQREIDFRNETLETQLSGANCVLPIQAFSVRLMTAGMQSPDYVWKTGELKVLQMPIEFPG
jgi:hypothetical protein